MEKIAHAVTADQQARREVGQDHKAEYDIEPFDPPRISRERRADNEDHSHDVEDQEPVAEAGRRRAVGLVPIA